MPRSPRSPEALDALLRDLGPHLRRGSEGAGSAGGDAGAAARIASGIPEIDRLLGGGLPRGGVSELAGPLSSGRTSLALALLARCTGAGELVAVVDGSDAFDPTSARAAGVDLARVLWVRAPALRDALRGSERLLAAGGFALVLLDLVALPRAPAPATWPRLARAASGTGTALVVLSAQRLAGVHADVAVEMRLARTRFSEPPLLLEQIESEVALVRCRAGRAFRVARVRLEPPAA